MHNELVVLQWEMLCVSCESVGLVMTKYKHDAMFCLKHHHSFFETVSPWSSFGSDRKPFFLRWERRQKSDWSARTVGSRSPRPRRVHGQDLQSELQHCGTVTVVAEGELTYLYPLLMVILW